MERNMKSKDLFYPKVTVNPNMKDYSKDPYILKKVDEVKEFMKKAGPPAELLKIRSGRIKK
jgi:hypothetical protein